MSDHGKVVLTEPAQRAMRQAFLGWQCRLRLLSMRQAGGRPTQGMRPLVAIPGERAPLGHITVLILHQAPEAATAEFRHIVKRTQDPVERWEAGVRIMQADHYQRPERFADMVTALFAEASAAAGRLAGAGRAVLDFEQYAQSFRLPSSIRELAEGDPYHAATLWHNRLFNPAMPGRPRVLAFHPDWAHGEASPAPGGT